MDVKLPNLGEGGDSGTVVTILVNEGQQISTGQNLIEIETGKAVVAVPSPAAGCVGGIRVKPGDKLSAGQVILSLAVESNGKTAAAPPASPSQSPRVTPPSPRLAEEREVVASQETGDEAPSDSPFPPPASPSIRKLARDLGIDLRHVKGSEHGGRIVLDDVRAYIGRLQKRASVPPGTAPSAPVPVTPPVSIDFAKWGPVTRLPMTSLRRVISQRMLESWTTIPHVTQFDEADISGILELRKKYKSAYEAKGAALTVTVFVLRALVAALKKHPIFNASIDDAAKEIVIKDHCHIGIAVDTEAGLIVPVIRDADRMTMAELSKALAGLAVKARDRKVTLEDLSGGTFTVSNQGGIGGAHFTPIVNKPEVAILGLGRGVVKPVVNNGAIIPATMLPICISYDHRLIDGGAAARFTRDLIGALESFDEAELKSGIE
jgi:pyruvate dehydrogenase E2 component (dihydrolipoamide acetyltransferase)